MHTCATLALALSLLATATAHATVFFTFSSPGADEFHCAPPDVGEPAGTLTYNAPVSLVIDTSEEGGAITTISAAVDFELAVGPVDFSNAPIIHVAPVNGTITFRDLTVPAGGACDDDSVILRATMSQGFLITQFSAGAGTLVAALDPMEGTSLIWRPGPAFPTDTPSGPIRLRAVPPSDFALTIVNCSPGSFVVVNDNTYFAPFSCDGAFSGAAPAHQCVGDTDDDGDTDVFDFNLFAPNFGNCVPTATGGDLDNDGDVDVFDFNLFAPDFGCGT